MAICIVLNRGSRAPVHVAHFTLHCSNFFHSIQVRSTSASDSLVRLLPLTLGCMPINLNIGWAIQVIEFSLTRRCLEGFLSNNVHGPPVPTLKRKPRGALKRKLCNQGSETRVMKQHFQNESSETKRFRSQLLNILEREVINQSYETQGYVTIIQKPRHSNKSYDTIICKAAKVSSQSKV